MWQKFSEVISDDCVNQYAGVFENFVILFALLTIRKHAAYQSLEFDPLHVRYTVRTAHPYNDSMT